ncbi:hypothetical protein ABDK56_03250 [Sphingomonas sp. ASV193]|uniref:hypothetical protein n=1 Tax=Sphingomonas sp. ASV193 TaxID=3144405 RepID=UPI0032E86B04
MSARIKPWRLTAGILLHFVIPAYCLWIGVALLRLWSRGATDEALAVTIVRDSLWFLAVYGLSAIVVTAFVRAIEPMLAIRRANRGRTAPPSAAEQSGARLDQALAMARRWTGVPPLVDLVARLEADEWDHRDPRTQGLTADLLKVITAFEKPLVSPKIDAGLADLAASALRRIHETAQLIAQERRDLDADDARTLARYIELRYPTSDLAGG